MESLARKRKGLKAPSFAGSDGGHHGRRSKRKCANRGGDSPPDPSSPPAGVIMTAPPAGRVSCISPGRGLKRKVGCIDQETRIGRRRRLRLEYTLGAHLGKGKFGSVTVCTRRSTGVRYACKSLAKADETVHREVEIMQHLSGHPGVVTIQGVFEDRDYFHLVMELCPGGRLLDKMTKVGKFSEDRAAKLITELVSVLKYCHEMGVVHRDVKPENILLTAAGKLKLADFGLAVRITTGQMVSGLAGSPAYVAPEVLLGEYSEKVDIWGAGVLLYALLVGALPFHGNSKDSVFESIKQTKLYFNHGVWESVSVQARDLVSRMLTRDMHTRPTAAEVLSHPWILLHTECSSKVVPTKSRVQNNHGVIKLSVSLESSTRKTGGQEEINHRMTKRPLSFESSTRKSEEQLEERNHGMMKRPSSPESSTGNPEKQQEERKQRIMKRPLSSESSTRNTEEQQEKRNHRMLKRPSTWVSSSRAIEEQECSIVDVLAGALSRMNISGPKRSRLCVLARPIEQQCSSNIKANLCTAAF